jgi:hypothetical protein
VPKRPRHLLHILRLCAIRRYRAGEIDVLAAQDVIGLTHILERVCFGDSCRQRPISYEGTGHGRDHQRTE